MYKHVFRYQIQKLCPSDAGRYYQKLLFEQLFECSKTSIKLQCIKLISLDHDDKVNKIYQLCYDSDPKVRIALLEKFKGNKKLFKMSVGRLYIFLTQFFNERNQEVKNVFDELLISFLTEDLEELPKQAVICLNGSDSEQDMDIGQKQDRPMIKFNNSYNIDGARRRYIKMSIFELFKRFKIHKTHYIDEFSPLPQSFQGFIFRVFDISDLIEAGKQVYQEIRRIIVEKSTHSEASFAHFSFLRQIMESLKISLRGELGGLEQVEELIPDIGDYELIFNYLEKHRSKEFLEMLAEWCKYGLQAEYSVPSIYESLQTLFMNYISNTDHTFEFYEHLIDQKISQYEDDLEYVEDGEDKLKVPELNSLEDFTL